MHARRGKCIDIVRCGVASTMQVKSRALGLRLQRDYPAASSPNASMNRENSSGCDEMPSFA